MNYSMLTIIILTFFISCKFEYFYLFYDTVLSCIHHCVFKECVGAENEMTLCCLCCKSGPIIAQLTLDCVGFVPGEGIPIRAEITNHSSRNIAGIGASLQMVRT